MDDIDVGITFTKELTDAFNVFGRADFNKDYESSVEAIIDITKVALNALKMLDVASHQSHQSVIVSLPTGVDFCKEKVLPVINHRQGVTHLLYCSIMEYITTVDNIVNPASVELLTEKLDHILVVCEAAILIYGIEIIL